MSGRPLYYELEIDHPIFINDVPVQHFEALEQELKTLPFWRALLASPSRFRPVRSKSTHITADTEHLAGRYDSFEVALDAARRIAVEKADELHRDANVLVVAITESDREVVDGFYPGGTDRI